MPTTYSGYCGSCLMKHCRQGGGGGGLLKESPVVEVLMAKTDYFVGEGDLCIFLLNSINGKYCQIQK